ncbi:MAG: DUF2157 domain-containing protein [Elainellaceae cyanobacterium]
MASDQFRRQLKRETARWQQDGWISPDQHARLAEHYRLEQVEEAAYGQFITLLISIGCLLVGIGCITFVAANWQLIPRLPKVLLLTTVFLAVNGTGFVLWRRPQSQSLGEGLLLLGALIFGGNLALMGQMFHQSGSGYGLCAAWSVGAMAMAYGLRLRSLGVLAQLLLGIAYVLWLRDVPWQWTEARSILDALLQQAPLVTVALFLPLTYYARSRSLFVLTALGTLASLVVTLAQLVRLAAPEGVAIALGLTLPVGLLWSYNDRFWLRGEAALTHSFRPASRAIAIIYLSAGLYLFSFHSFWASVSSDVAEALPLTDAIFPGLSVALLLLVSVAGWIHLGWPRRDRPWRLSATDAVVLGLLGIVAGVCLVHWHVEPAAIVATFLFNVLLAVLGIGIMREGLEESNRAQFWLGLVLLVLQILSRVLEYNTGLLIKSLTFLACGVAVITLGLWFERYARLSRRSTTNHP